MIRVAIVGCGKIADEHAALVETFPDCRIVGVCDREELMAQQLSERFKVGAHFTDVRTLLERAAPDVVHVTTPPQSHYEIAKLALDAGAHAVVEKPFTVHAQQARELVGLARRVNRKLTVHHEQQFTDPARRARRLIADGFLGGPPVHMESYYGYELGDDVYAKAVLGDREHWVRRLPGRLLHNVISHGISKIAEYVPTDAPTVIAHGFSSPFARRVGEGDIIDELRVIVSDGTGFTAYFTFSSQSRPNLHLLRVYGTKNGLEIDHDQRTLIVLAGTRRKSVLEKVVSPGSYALQYVRGAAGNVRRFLKRELHPRDGSIHLLERFYASVRNGTDPPIGDEEIIVTVQIMDDIFAQVYGAKQTDLVRA